MSTLTRQEMDEAIENRMTICVPVHIINILGKNEIIYVNLSGGDLRKQMHTYSVKEVYVAEESRIDGMIFVELPE